MESEFLRHEPCLNCGSSDANSVYTDDHTYCFVCHHYVGGDNENHTHQMKHVHLQGAAQRLKKEAYPRKPVSFIKSTEKETSYVSIISQMMEYFKEQK